MCCGRCVCGRHGACVYEEPDKGGQAPCPDGPACPDCFTGAPHFGQNAAPALCAAPHLPQNRGAAVPWSAGDAGVLVHIYTLFFLLNWRVGRPAHAGPTVKTIFRRNCIIWRMTEKINRLQCRPRRPFNAKREACSQSLTAGFFTA
jgi:hypothetical protein